MALGMPPEHQLSGPGQPGAAREPPGAPNGRHQPIPAKARPDAIFEGLQESTKIAPRTAGEAAAGGGDGRGDGLGAGDGGGGVGGGVGDLGGTSVARIQGAVRVPSGWLQGGSGRARRQKLGSEGGDAP
jgi:hypothetical protein